MGEHLQKKVIILNKQRYQQQHMEVTKTTEKILKLLVSESN